MYYSPGARFSKPPKTFRALKAIFKKPVLKKNREVYTLKALFTRKPHRFRCGYTFRLQGTGPSSLSEPGRFENAFKSGAFSKRYGFIGRVNDETTSI